ncbi:MAG: tetratricopeptide repeat protein [bacterium]|nr:tetratricopeptide repeat protein [bacterium]
MLIRTNAEKNLTKAINYVSLPIKSRSYELCIKADALRFSKLYKESVKCYLDSIMMDRNHQEAYLGLATSYKYLNEYKKSINILEKLIKLDDKNDKYFFEMGVCCLSDGRPEDAIPNLIQSIILNKENLEAQIQLAIAHELVDEADLSLMIYDKLIETNPEYLKAYYNKGAMLMGMGDFINAAKTFFKLIKRNPDYYKAYLGIAMSFDKLEKYPNAIRYYKKFLELKSLSEDAVFAKKRVDELKKLIGKKQNNNLKLI